MTTEQAFYLMTRLFAARAWLVCLIENDTLIETALSEMPSLHDKRCTFEWLLITPWASPSIADQILRTSAAVIDKRAG